jgi:hypothetical protein
MPQKFWADCVNFTKLPKDKNISIDENLITLVAFKSSGIELGLGFSTIWKFLGTVDFD